VDLVLQSIPHQQPGWNPQRGISPLNQWISCIDGHHCRLYISWVSAQRGTSTESVNIVHRWPSL
jgi:hypothetical protein